MLSGVNILLYKILSLEIFFQISVILYQKKNNIYILFYFLYLALFTRSPFGIFYEELKQKSSLSLYLLPFTLSLYASPFNSLSLCPFPPSLSISLLLPFSLYHFLWRIQWTFSCFCTKFYKKKSLKPKSNTSFRLHNIHCECPTCPHIFKWLMCTETMFFDASFKI